jgi:4-hydroxy-tetrahydrodipicolinate reductase
MGRLKFIQYGMGPIGSRIAEYLLERDGVELAAAIDIDPGKTGCEVAALLTGGAPVGIRVSGDAERTLAETDADIVVLSTLSSFARLEEQLRLCIKHGKNVISSCEEMAYPWEENNTLAASLDQAAKEAGVTLLSTGVNPGFSMDALPLFMTSVCRRVEAIHIVRHQDAALRRLPFQQKIGAGLPLDEFREKVKARHIRHVGFTESIQMIAKAFGWQLDRIEDVVEPMVADRTLESSGLKVVRGAAAGVRQKATGYLNGKAVINIELQACLGHPRPKDSIRIEGEPSLYSEVAGGFPGDVATCAMVANAVPAVLCAAPGLKTMIDVGLTAWQRGMGQ